LRGCNGEILVQRYVAGPIKIKPVLSLGEQGGGQQKQGRQREDKTSGSFHERSPFLWNKGSGGYYSRLLGIWSASANYANPGNRAVLTSIYRRTGNWRLGIFDLRINFADIIARASVKQEAGRRKISNCLIAHQAIDQEGANR